MALIDQNMQPATDVADTGAPPSENDVAAKPAAGPTDASALSPEKVDASIKLPPELQAAFQRVVVAGMKVMFDPKTHQLALQQMTGSGPIAERLGGAIAKLMLLLFKQSNNTMPPQVLIPAGTALLVRAADFLKKSGIEQITDQDVAGALEVMITTLLQQSGLDPQKVGAAGAGAPAQPGGLVNQNAPPEPTEGAPAEEATPADQQEA